MSDKVKLKDAVWGKQGFFTLVEYRGRMYIHYNKQPDGYAVFKMEDMDEQIAQHINRSLYDLLREHEEKKRHGKGPNQKY